MPTMAEWDPIIGHGSRVSGLDPDLIRAVIRVESNNDHLAISPKGAQGLMQLMPGTQAHLGVTDPFDPRANVEAGSLYLRRQLDAFGTLELALAAYNAGPGNVQRHGGIPLSAKRRISCVRSWRFTSPDPSNKKTPVSEIRVQRC